MVAASAVGSVGTVNLDTFLNSAEKKFFNSVLGDKVFPETKPATEPPQKTGLPKPHIGSRLDMRV